MAADITPIRPDASTRAAGGQNSSQGFRASDFNDVSKYIQQALATVVLLENATAGTQLVIPGTRHSTLSNSLWAIDELLQQAQHALNGGHVFNAE